MKSGDVLTMATLMLASPAFKDGGMIPPAYTCDGENVSPPLEWSAPPQGTQSLALIADDPDAPGGVWVHWVLYNLLPTAQKLPRAYPKDEKMDDGTMQGKNDFGDIGYGGPCPPSGAHRYFFKLYALDMILGIAPGLTKKELEQNMEGHILTEARLQGLYRRR